MQRMPNPLDEIVARYFERPEVLSHYLRATAGVGLWRSEEAIFQRYFDRDATLLELGCGTGRIALALHELGYEHLLGIDLSRAMIEEARRAAQTLDYTVAFQVGDATRLRFEDALFDGAIFGFNGLMQIPGRERRRQALSEIRRVLSTGAHFIFTTHDRSLRAWRDFWEEEAGRWAAGEQPRELLEFGDRIIRTDRGELFIHVPSAGEILEDLAATGWELVENPLRQELANEPEIVRAFADECRFWVLRKGRDDDLG